jgi:hypothetical protein
MIVGFLFNQTPLHQKKKRRILCLGNKTSAANGTIHRCRTICTMEVLFLQFMFINSTCSKHVVLKVKNCLQIKSHYNFLVDALASPQKCNTWRVFVAQKMINLHESLALIAKPHGSHQHLQDAGK